jgi:hypothetical protein
MEVTMIAERPQPSATSLEDLAWLVAAEYNEMPGMRLTFDQAKRLFNLSTEDCRKVLTDLVDAKLLMEDTCHRYCRCK